MLVKALKVETPQVFGVTLVWAGVTLYLFSIINKWNKNI